MSKQILIISGGELLDDDAVQVCMKTRDTGAGTVCSMINLSYSFDCRCLGRKSDLFVG